MVASLSVENGIGIAPANLTVYRVSEKIPKVRRLAALSSFNREAALPEMKSLTSVGAE